MPLRGHDYTWRNHRESPVLAKLDRFLISSDWDDLFPLASQRVLPNPCSDHAPVKNFFANHFKTTTPFRFDRSWLSHSEVNAVVSNAWNSVSSNDAIINLVRKIKALRVFETLVCRVKGLNKELKPKLLNLI